MDTDITRHLHPPLPPRVRAPGGWEALGMLLLYFVLQALVSFLLGLVIGTVMVLRDHPQGWQEAVTDTRAALSQPAISAWLVLGSLLISGAAIAWLVRRRWPTLWRLSPLPGLGLTRAARAGDYPLAGLLGLALPVVGGVLTQWLAHGHPVPQDIKQLGAQVSMTQRILLSIVAVGVAPFIEELLFRGVLLSAWQRRLGAAPAVLASALMFALVHLPDLKFLWYGLPNLALLGITFGWLRLRSHSLWPAVIAHGMNNLLSTAAWFLAAS